MDTWSQAGYARWKRAQRGWSIRLALAALFIMLGAGSRLHAQGLMPKVSQEGMIAEAEWVVVADLVAQMPQRNAHRDLIVNDYRFHALDVPDSGFVPSRSGGMLGG